MADTPPTFREMFWYWLKLGFISFGGPAGQIAMMHRELVEKRRWISEARFLHALNYCMLLPGPEAQQLTIYLGWLMHRTLGGVVAGTLFILPSLLILMLLTHLYLAYGELPVVQGMFAGIKPAVVAIVLFAAWRIGKRTLVNGWLWAIAGSSFLALFWWRIPFPAVVLGAGVAGMIGGRLAPHRFAMASGHAADPDQTEETSVRPEHTRFKASRLVVQLLAFVGIWGVGMAIMGHPVLRDMGSFFSKAALVTFGGAYAVLPYVYQGGVEQFGWLTGTQMVDGLALGETTPGPLIMVVAFVGYVGGWSKAIFGPDALGMAGVAGAAVATFFTFLPSYFFILAGAPLIESTHGQIHFTAPLTAITAAVVGVILDLALFFAWHVFWPAATPDHPFLGGIAWFQLLLAGAAFIAMWRFGQEVTRVIVVCLLIGLLSII
ncbi:MAG: chromate efflux transporter [Magnetococcales bacterium]|nr:chromate efflux transporter [Magnetococcales bacterium]